MYHTLEQFCRSLYTEGGQLTVVNFDALARGRGVAPCNIFHPREMPLCILAGARYVGLGGVARRARVYGPEGAMSLYPLKPQMLRTSHLVGQIRCVGCPPRSVVRVGGRGLSDHSICGWSGCNRVGGVC